MNVQTTDSEAVPRIHIAWVLRPTVWFATAYTIIIIFHEAAHALTAAALGIPSTLFNFWVNHEFARASADERAVVFVAGPAASLLVGSAGWFIYRRVRNSAAGLPFLYLTAFGVTNFFGNLMSAAFVGDFSNAAVRLGMSQTARVVAALTGAIAVAGVLFAVGRELWQWTPRHAGRIGGALGFIVVPSLVGMAVVVLINQPTPMGPSFVTARTAEGLFWLFAAIGLLITRQARAADLPPVKVHWTDGAVAIGVILAVRVMARGISLMP
jgi:hypothetical protein